MKMFSKTLPLDRAPECRSRIEAPPSEPPKASPSFANFDPDDSSFNTDEDEAEPKLKYIRLSKDVLNILKKDALTAIAVHSKFICLGTQLGEIYFVDIEGNICAPRQKMPHHMVSVNQISMDRKGEFIASCSDDGTVAITGLYTYDNDQQMNLGKTIKCIALDPQYYKSNTGRRFVLGDTKLTLFEKTFYKSLKSTILSESEGYVSAIAWTDQFIAWASCLGVRVYDLAEKCSLGLIRWEEPKNSNLKDFRCNLRWSNSSTLLIGWVDTIRICVLRKRNAIEVSSKDLPGFIVDPISTFQTEFYICGLAPLEKNKLVVLGFSKETDPETKKSLRPLLCVLQYEAYSCIEICTDSLTTKGYQDYKVNDYCLDYLDEEKQYFILAPKDIVVASLYENDDRIEWLIEHRRFEQAMEMIATQGGRYSLISVARLYLDHLLNENRYQEAAQLCHRAFGNDKTLWEEEVYKFVKIQQLRSICPYLPRSPSCRLNPHVYEIVLFEYLKLDTRGFLELIKTWDSTLYATSAVINAVEDHVTEENKAVLMEALALLYTYEEKFDKAINMYLKLQNKAIFELIRKHSLFRLIHKSIVPLMNLDQDKAIEMLLEKDRISSDIVVQQLEQKREFLLLYLDRLVKVDANSGNHHWKLVNLYAEFSRDKLLPFLKKSHNYPIREALEMCKKKQFYDEMVYLLERMGDPREALFIIIKKMGNIERAIEFCKEINDQDLWEDLIEEALQNPNIITKLLDGIAGYINPQLLVNRIKKGVEIPGLKKSLVKMLMDYSLQVTIHDGCNDILMKDYFHMHERFAAVQQGALFLSQGSRCGRCAEEIISKGPLKTDIVVFNCHHFFHETCLQSESCIVCKAPN